MQANMDISLSLKLVDIVYNLRLTCAYEIE